VRLALTIAVLLVALAAFWALREAEFQRTADRNADRTAAEAPEREAETAASPEAAESTEENEATTEEPRPTRVRTFRAVDEHGDPAPRAWAQVFARTFDEKPRDAVSGDGLGTLRLRLYEEDEHLVVGAPGFARVKVKSPWDREETDVVLPRGYRIAGVVVDAEDAPVSGARLELSFPWMPDMETTTDARGRFSFEDLGAEQRTLEVRAQRFLRTHARVSPGDDDVRIVLERPVTVTGVVVFPDETPAPGAKVNGRVATDKSGRFSLPGQRPGRLQLWAQLKRAKATWNGKATCDVTREGAPFVRIVLERRPRSWVRVRVVDADGEPVAEQTVSGRGMQAPYPKTDEAGRATCGYNLPPGSATVVGVHEFGRWRGDLLPGFAEVVTAPRPDGPEVLLAPREPVRVVAVARGPTGAPLPPDVHAGVELGASRRRVVRNERHGTAYLVDPASPYFYVRADAVGYVRRRLKLEELPDDGLVEVRLQPGATLRCRIANASSETWVRAWVRGGSGSTGVGEDGVCVVRGLAEGEARVTAGRGDLPLFRTDVTLRAGKTTDLGTIVLGEPAVVEGRVTAASGEPLGGVRVTVRGDGFESDEVFTRADGVFRTRVPPGLSGHVVARKEGHADMIVPATRGPLEIALPEPGRLRLEVRILEVRAGRAMSFEVRRPDSDEAWSPEWKRVSEDPQTYEFEGLPPGRLVAIVRTRPEDAETEVVIVPGETAMATVEVK